MMRILLTLTFSALLLLIVRDYAVADRLQHRGTSQMAVLANGLTALGLPHAGPDSGGLFEASAPGCSAPLVLGLFAIDGGENSRFEALIAPGTHPVFVYLGNVGNRPDRWGNASALAGALIRGLAQPARDDRVPTKMAVAILPDTCPGLANRNWAVLSPRE